MGPRPKHSWGLLRSGTFSHLSHVAVSRASLLLRHQVSQIYSSSESEGMWSASRNRVTQDTSYKCRLLGPARNILNLSDWGLGPGFGIYNNCPHLTLTQSNALESVSVDTGSPFHGETTHQKAESIVCRNPENLPPGNILSAACKTPQAVQVDSMEKDSPDGIWILEQGRVQTPFPKEWLLQQRAEREVSNAATATIMFQPERCCPSLWHTPQSWVWLLRDLWSGIF